MDVCGSWLQFFGVILTTISDPKHTDHSTSNEEQINHGDQSGFNGFFDTLWSGWILIQITVRKSHWSEDNTPLIAKTEGSLQRWFHYYQVLRCKEWSDSCACYDVNHSTNCPYNDYLSITSFIPWSCICMAGKGEPRDVGSIERYHHMIAHQPIQVLKCEQDQKCLSLAKQNFNDRIGFQFVKL